MDRPLDGVDGPRAMSPWPLFVALGIVLSELGVLMGGPLIPVAVGGIVLLEGSVVGVLREAGYTNTLWKAALAIGVVFLLVGVVLVVRTQVDVRGTAIALAGTVALVAGAVLWFVERTRLSTQVE